MLVRRLNHPFATAFQEDGHSRIADMMGSMTIPKSNHFVPEFLLHRFTNAHGRLYLFDKRRPEAGVRDPKPKEAFTQNHLNTIVHKDGSKDVGLELWYQKMEGEVSPVVEKIVERARALKLPSLTQAERNIWDNFVYHQQKQAPDGL